MRVLTVNAISLCACLCFCGQLVADDPSKGSKADATKLTGAYKIVAGEKNGQPVSKDRLDGITVRIATNAITTLDKDEKEVYVATYELDSSQKPWRIMMTATVAPAEGKGTKAVGLIEMEGDTVKLIYALPAGKAPTQFKAGDKQQMFVLKRAGK